jgi:hypothetical protein
MITPTSTPTSTPTNSALTGDPGSTVHVWPADPSFVAANDLAQTVLDAGRAARRSGVYTALQDAVLGLWVDREFQAGRLDEVREFVLGLLRSVALNRSERRLVCRGGRRRDACLAGVRPTDAEPPRRLISSSPHQSNAPPALIVAPLGAGELEAA